MAACEGCGAACESLVCPACGRATALIGDPSTERRALEELHAAAAKAEDEAAGRLLTSGFLPSSIPLLIEAGLRCVALCGESSSYHLKAGAHARLEAVTAKLRILPQDQSTRTALERFEAKLAEAKHSARNDVLIFLGVAVLLLTLLGATVAFVLLR